MIKGCIKLRSCRSILLFRLAHCKYGGQRSNAFSNSAQESSELCIAQSSRDQIVKEQNDLFSSLKSKIMSAKIPRIEKIKVEYRGRNIADDATMLMNKMLSTPYQCAMHISKNLADDSVLALVKKNGESNQQDGVIVAVKTENARTDVDDSNPSTEVITLGEISQPEWIPWDMHRPLDFDCEIKLLKYNMYQPEKEEMIMINRAYWKSCSLILGAVAQEAFQEDVDIKLAYLPNISEKNGAFCYDINLSKDLIHSDGSAKWIVDESVLIALTKTARNILSQKLRFEYLEIHKDDAKELFKHNEYQLQRIEKNVYLSLPNSYIPVYKFGKYIDICEGPLIPSTESIYHFVVTAVHQLKCSDPDRTGTCLWRFQGLSLPKQLQVHHAIWAMLEHRARNLVKQDLPFSIMESDAHHFNASLHKYQSIENETKKYSHATGQWLQDKWDLSNEKLKIPER
ncbi:large ribosomal subunit protein mL39-like [Styela clava]